MLDMLLHHDGRDWVVEYEGDRLAAATLEDLDRCVGDYVREKGLLRAGASLRVRMLFQNATIPQWIRQYAQHYFNRIVEVRA